MNIPLSIILGGVSRRREVTLLCPHRGSPCRKPRRSGRGGGAALAVHILFDGLKSCPSCAGGEIGRRPQNAVPIAFSDIRGLLSKQATGRAFKSVDENRN